MVAGHLDIQAQETHWIFGEGDGSTFLLKLRILQLSNRALQ